MPLYILQENVEKALRYKWVRGDEQPGEEYRFFLERTNRCGRLENLRFGHFINIGPARPLGELCSRVFMISFLRVHTGDYQISKVNVGGYRHGDELLYDLIQDGIVQKVYNIEAYRGMIENKTDDEKELDEFLSINHIMESAIGLNKHYKLPPTNELGQPLKRYIACRNYYNISPNCCGYNSIKRIVKAGYMEEFSRDFFRVTPAGVAYMEKKYNLKIFFRK